MGAGGPARKSLTDYAPSWIIYDLALLIMLETVREHQRYRLAYWDNLVWAGGKIHGVANGLSEDCSYGLALEGAKFTNSFSSHFDIATLKELRLSAQPAARFQPDALLTIARQEQDTMIRLSLGLPATRLCAKQFP